MGQIDTSKLPYNTSNAILAYCLHLAGVPWLNNNQACRVLYSPDILNKFTNGSGQRYYKDWKLEDAVKHAHKHNRRGHVEYIFQRIDELPVLLKAYSDQVKELEAGEGTLNDVITRLAENLAKSPSAANMVKLCCVILKMRVEFVELWKAQVPIVLVPNTGKVTQRTTTIHTKHGPREAREVTSPGFKMYSLNASEETRKHLKV